jgi:hypothetical protein
MVDHISDIIKQLGINRLSEFNPGVLVDVDNRRVEVILENVQYYGEWLKGEGGDMAIYRAMDDNRVIGGVFELRVWNGKFPVAIHDSSENS